MSDRIPDDVIEAMAAALPGAVALACCDDRCTCAHPQERWDCIVREPPEIAVRAVIAAAEKAGFVLIRREDSFPVAGFATREQADVAAARVLDGGFATTGNGSDAHR